MILASEGEIISEVRTYNGDYELPVPVNLDVPEGFLIWEGTVRFFTDGEEQWNGNWRYADYDEIEHWSSFRNLLPDTFEKAINYLNLKDKIVSMSELVQQFFGSSPTLEYEKSFPPQIIFNILIDVKDFGEEDNDAIKKIVDLQSEWYRTVIETFPDIISGISLNVDFKE